jgi:preprotein translocase subunit SecG
MVKTAIVALVVAFIIFYVMTSPDQAADMAKGIGHLTKHVANGIGDFLNKLAS